MWAGTAKQAKTAAPQQQEKSSSASDLQESGTYAQGKGVF